jgi:hypothetical protein
VQLCLLFCMGILLKLSFPPQDLFKNSTHGNTLSYAVKNHILGKTAIICPLESVLRQQLRSGNYMYSLWSLCVEDLILTIGILKSIYIIWYGIIVNWFWVDTRWQYYSTHLHTNTRWQYYSTHLHTNTRWQCYSTHLHTNTRWQYYNTHLHTNHTEKIQLNRITRTYITLRIHNLQN